MVTLFALSILFPQDPCTWLSKRIFGQSYKIKEKRRFWSPESLKLAGFFVVRKAQQGIDFLQTSVLDRWSNEQGVPLTFKPPTTVFPVAKWQPSLQRLSVGFKPWTRAWPQKSEFRRLGDNYQSCFTAPLANQHSHSPLLQCQGMWRKISSLFLDSFSLQSISWSSP